MTLRSFNYSPYCGIIKYQLQNLVQPGEEGYMELLKDRILKDGKSIGKDILKVDSFLNHQIDVALVAEMGREFARLFAGLGVNKILTIEASGIPIAYATAHAMGDIPLVFAKKTTPNTMTDGVYSAEVRSFTKGTVSHVIVNKNYLQPGDVVLLIDDFLALGEAASGLAEICTKAGAKCVGLGAAIEKKYQGGAEKIRKLGLKVESLAVIASLGDGKIEFDN